MTLRTQGGGGLFKGTRTSWRWINDTYENQPRDQRISHIGIYRPSSLLQTGECSFVECVPHDPSAKVLGGRCDHIARASLISGFSKNKSGRLTFLSLGYRPLEFLPGLASMHSCPSLAIAPPSIVKHICHCNGPAHALNLQRLSRSRCDHYRRPKAHFRHLWSHLESTSYCAGS